MNKWLYILGVQGLAALLVSGTVAEEFGSGTHAFTMEFSDMGWVGNIADSSPPFNELDSRQFGSVDHSYGMGIHEVTVAQFEKAVNVDGRIGDGNENYWNDGTNHLVGAGAPSSFVSWYEAARFANWLTSGDAYIGAYQFDTNGVLVAVDREAAMVAYDKIYVIPTEDEWYKAAYYRPVDDGSYSLYSHGFDSKPPCCVSNGWNYSLVNDGTNEMWAAGYGGVEQNGTRDMNGNIWEWMESAWDQELDDVHEGRGLRDGGAHDTSFSMRSTFRHSAFDPASEHELVGFRVATLPASQAWIEASVVGNGSVNISAGWQPLETNLNIVAIPISNALFMGWSGDVVGDYTTADTNIVVEGDLMLVATFSNDADADGLLNSEETLLGSNPRNADSDGDGLRDKWEVDQGMDPVLADAGLDLDGDGLSALQEFELGTDPALADTDGDSVSDFDEVVNVVTWGDDYYRQLAVTSNAVRAIDAVAGGSHGLALLPDGTVEGWGDDTYGQSTVPAGISNFIQIAAGDAHSLAVLSNGNVVAWGDDYYDQASVPISLSNVLAVAGGARHSLALMTNGTLRAWGDNSHGQLNVPVGISNAVAISCGDYHSMAQLADGSILAWGSNVHGESTVPGSATNVLAIAAGNGHSLALLSTGSVVAWGLDDFGQSTVPTNVKNAMQMGGGGYHSLVQLADGNVVAWGNPFYNILDVPTRTKFAHSMDGGRLFSVALVTPTDPLKADTDLDGLDDGTEIQILGTDALAADTDGDMLPDGWEITNGLNPLADDATLDPDSDSLSSLEEYGFGTNPNNPDTDGDAMPEGWEIEFALDPLVTNALADADADDYEDLYEYAMGGNPTNSGNSGFVPQYRIMTVDGTNRLDFMHAINTNASLSYVVEISNPGGSSWTNAALSSTGTNALTNGFIEVTNRLDAAVVSNLFIRLAIFSASNTVYSDELEVTSFDIWAGTYGLYGTHALNHADADDDGLSNMEEFGAGTDPTVDDSDGDGLTDGLESITYGTDPLVPDSDGDGLTDGAEVNTHGTNPLVQDSDGDAMPDDWEITYSLDPLVTNALADADADGYEDLYEYALGGDPTNTGSSGFAPNYRIVLIDGTNRLDLVHAVNINTSLSYMVEVREQFAGSWTNAGHTITGTNVLGNGFHELTNRLEEAVVSNLYIRVAISAVSNTVYSDVLEVTLYDLWAATNGLYGTNALADADSDGDGLQNQDEFGEGTDPTVADSDGDGLSDGAEVNTHGTDPLAQDSDGDKLNDGDEIETYATNPMNPDSDGDTFGDGLEAANGGNPMVSDYWRVEHIRNNGSTYNLYSSNTVVDISMGEASFVVTNGVAGLSLQLERSMDLNTWTNAGTPKYWSIPVDQSNAFYRVRSGR